MNENALDFDSNVVNETTPPKTTSGFLVAWSHFPFPFPILIPLIIWLLNRNNETGFQAKQAFYWQASWTTIFTVSAFISTFAIIFGVFGGSGSLSINLPIVGVVNTGGIGSILLLLIGLISLLIYPIIALLPIVLTLYGLLKAYESIKCKHKPYPLIGKRIQENKTLALNILSALGILILIGFVVMQALMIQIAIDQQTPSTLQSMGTTNGDALTGNELFANLIKDTNSFPDGMIRQGKEIIIPEGTEFDTEKIIILAEVEPEKIELCDNFIRTRTTTKTESGAWKSSSERYCNQTKKWTRHGFTSNNNFATATQELLLTPAIHSLDDKLYIYFFEEYSSEVIEETRG